ncbi:MAG: hypothetical protein ACI8XO_000750 [Verrucomicrobiales bacterium]|jgi:hypothetical protein
MEYFIFLLTKTDLGCSKLNWTRFLDQRHRSPTRYWERASDTVLGLSLPLGFDFRVKVRAFTNLINYSGRRLITIVSALLPIP